MTRIAELQTRYPTMPQDVIVKWEVFRNGIRDTEDLDKVSEWTRSLFSYQSYDQDLTLKELAENRPRRQRPGYQFSPGHFFMKSGVGVRIERNSRSPYEIRDVGNGKFALFEGDQKVDVDIYFIRQTRSTEEPVTSKGTPVYTLIRTNRRCFALMPVRHCEYFNTGDQCKFCNFNGTQEDSRSIGVDRATTINLEDTVEAYKILGSNVSFIEGRLEMGGLTGDEQEAKIHLAFVERLASAASPKPNLTVHGQPFKRKDLQRLRDAGTNSLVMQSEVWDPKLFAEICPGKAKRDGYQRYLESYSESVDVLGAGNVTTNFVGGVTLVPPNGFKTWQEARDSQIEGNTHCIKQGVFPSFTNLRLPPGSIYGADPSLRAKIPPTEYYLDVVQAHHEAMMEYGLYQKLNKFMYCAFDCLGVYNGEMGMLALAGDVGKWMAEVVPDESNWLAQFIASVKSLTKTQ